MSMNQLIKFLSILTGLVMLVGCATDGYVSTSVTYYDPYPVYIGPPVVIYPRHHYYYHPRPHSPVIGHPPLRRMPPPAIRHDVRPAPPTSRPQTPKSHPQIQNERRNPSVERRTN